MTGTKVRPYPKKQQVRRSKNLTTKERDKLWRRLSKQVRTEKPLCEVCGKMPKPKGLHAHHMVPRSQSTLLYLARFNIISACYHCHDLLERNPFFAHQFYEAKFGKEFCEQMRQLSLITGISRTYDEVVAEMDMGIEEYARKYRRAA